MTGLIAELTRRALVTSIVEHWAVRLALAGDLKSSEGVAAAKDNRWKGGVVSEFKDPE